jgi:hypothetical protein
VVIVFLLWIIPIVFISLLLLLSYKIVSKINHKKSSSKHKTIPDFTYQNLKEDPSNKNLKPDTLLYLSILTVNASIIMKKLKSDKNV